MKNSELDVDRCVSERSDLPLSAVSDSTAPVTSAFADPLDVTVSAGPIAICALSSLPTGREGVVARIGGSRLEIRLRELGVVPGAPIRLLRSSCPMVFQVGEDRLSIRKKDADHIGVQIATASP